MKAKKRIGDSCPQAPSKDGDCGAGASNVPEPAPADQDELAVAREAVWLRHGMKAILRVLGKKIGKGKGEHWGLFKSLQVVEAIPGREPVRLDNSLVRQVIAEAIEANDWDRLHALCYWLKHHKPSLPDPLEAFMVEHWKDLRHLNDVQIAKQAKAQGIDGATCNTVRDRRLFLRLQRFRKRRES